VPPKTYRYLGRELSRSEYEAQVAANRRRAREDEQRAILAFNSLFANPVTPQILGSLSQIELENEFDRQLLQRLFEKASAHGYIRPIHSLGPGYRPQWRLAAAVDDFLAFEGNPIRGPAMFVGEKPSIAELNELLIARFTALRAHLNGYPARYSAPDPSPRTSESTAAALRREVESFISELNDGHLPLSPRRSPPATRRSR
jgi:hypothetical protein